MKILFILSQLVLFIGFAPLLSGLISRVKNNLRMRKGQSIFQPYFNLCKLCSKDEVISRNASWLFRAAPFIVFASSIAACLLVPVFYLDISRYLGDFLALVFIFALGRFFIALAALDTASSFGGMGSSREMFVSSLAEPIICLIIFSLSVQYGTTDLSIVGNSSIFKISSFLAAIALFIVILAETSRIPVDNQETHLELTMIHEAMILEYSGRSFALIELSSYIKQMVWFLILANVLCFVKLPQIVSFPGMLLWVSIYLIRLIAIGVIVAFVEISLAKMRLFRVADLFTLAFALTIISVVCAIIKI